MDQLSSPAPKECCMEFWSCPAGGHAIPRVSRLMGKRLDSHSMGLYEDARDQAWDRLRRTAADRTTITYSELVGHIGAWMLEPDSPVLAKILDEISTQEDGAGRGMLSAVVVHKTDDYLPGPGFFALASQLGRDVSDKVAFHAQELERVFQAFSR